MATVVGIQDMRHDLGEFLPDMTRREKVKTLLRFYCPITKGWADPLVSRFERWRYPMPKPDVDTIARHFGWVEGVPHCPIGEVCEHGWVLTQEAAEGGGLV